MQTLLLPPSHPVTRSWLDHVGLAHSAQRTGSQGQAALDELDGLAPDLPPREVERRLLRAAIIASNAAAFLSLALAGWEKQKQQEDERRRKEEEEAKRSAELRAAASWFKRLRWWLADRVRG